MGRKSYEASLQQGDAGAGKLAEQVAELARGARGDHDMAVLTWAPRAGPECALERVRSKELDTAARQRYP